MRAVMAVLVACAGAALALPSAGRADTAAPASGTAGAAGSGSAAAPQAPSQTVDPLAQPTERVASTGWFAEGGLGATTFLPKASNDAALGPSINLRGGRDLFSWLSVGVFFSMSTHEATVPPPPTDQYFQLYRGGVDARIGHRFNRLSIFAEGSIGLAVISTNVLDQVMFTTAGNYTSFAVQAGGGFEYQLENRHYGFGLAGDALVTPGFGSLKAVDTRLYLRYTY
jgi:hypothetical protein